MRCPCFRTPCLLPAMDLVITNHRHANPQCLSVASSPVTRITCGTHKPSVTWYSAFRLLREPVLVSVWFLFSFQQFLHGFAVLFCAVLLCSIVFCLYCSCFFNAFIVMSLLGKAGGIIRMTTSQQKFVTEGLPSEDWRWLKNIKIVHVFHLRASHGCFFFIFNSCIFPFGFLPWEVRVSFPGESQL